MKPECMDCPIQQRCQELILDKFAESQSFHLLLTSQAKNNKELTGYIGKSLQEMLRVRDKLERLIDQDLSVDERIMATSELQNVNETISEMLSTGNDSLDRIQDYQDYERQINEQTNVLVSNYLDIARVAEASCTGPRRRKKYLIFGKTIVKCSTYITEVFSALNNDADADSVRFDNPES